MRTHNYFVSFFRLLKLSVFTKPKSSKCTADFSQPKLTKAFVATPECNIIDFTDTDFQTRYIPKNEVQLFSNNWLKSIRTPVLPNSIFTSTDPFKGHYFSMLHVLSGSCIIYCTRNLVLSISNSFPNLKEMSFYGP